MTDPTPTGTRRLPPDDRRDAILQAAIRLAVTDGYFTLTRESAAQAAGVSPGLVSRYFYATALLRATVMREAVSRGILSIIAEGLATRCPIACAAPAELRAAAVASLAAGVGV